MPRSELIERKQKPEDFLHTLVDYLSSHFFNYGVEILPSEEAEAKISEHPKCLFF